MSGLLAAIGCALLGLAVGAALQRWGDAERRLHGHKEPMGKDNVLEPLHRQITAYWEGW